MSVAKEYVCACGFTSTRATVFFKHLKEHPAEGGTAATRHRLVTSAFADGARVPVHPELRADAESALLPAQQALLDRSAAQTELALSPPSAWPVRAPQAPRPAPASPATFKFAHPMLGGISTPPSASPAPGGGGAWQPDPILAARNPLWSPELGLQSPEPSPPVDTTRRLFANASPAAPPAHPNAPSPELSAGALPRPPSPARDHEVRISYGQPACSEHAHAAPGARRSQQLHAAAAQLRASFAAGSGDAAAAVLAAGAADASSARALTAQSSHRTRQAHSAAAQDLLKRTARSDSPVAQARARGGGRGDASELAAHATGACDAPTAQRVAGPRWREVHEGTPVDTAAAAQRASTARGDDGASAAPERGSSVAGGADAAAGAGTHRRMAAAFAAAAADAPLRPRGAEQVHARSASAARGGGGAAAPRPMPADSVRSSLAGAEPRNPSTWADVALSSERSDAGAALDRQPSARRATDSSHCHNTASPRSGAGAHELPVSASPLRHSRSDDGSNRPRSSSGSGGYPQPQRGSTPPPYAGRPGSSLVPGSPEAAAVRRFYTQSTLERASSAASAADIALAMRAALTWQHPPTSWRWLAGGVYGMLVAQAAAEGLATIKPASLVAAAALCALLRHSAQDAWPVLHDALLLSPVTRLSIFASPKKRAPPCSAVALPAPDAAAAALAHAPSVSQRFKSRLLGWLPRSSGPVATRSSAAADAAAAVADPPPATPRRRSPSPTPALSRRAQAAACAAVAVALPAVEALTLLLREVFHQRRSASVGVTVACLWLVLLVSECAVLSQWHVAALAYALAFAAPLAYVRYAAPLQQLADGLRIIFVDTLPAARHRGKVAMAGAVAAGAFCGLGGPAVVRVTAAAAGAAVVALLLLHRECAGIAVGVR